MHANEVRNLNWIQVTTWSKMPVTYRNSDCFATKADVENFVESIFMDVARKLDIPYTELQPILKEKNSAFYSTLEKVSTIHGRLTFFDFFNLKNLLRIPDVTKVSDTVNKSNVKRVLAAFSTLSDSEKLEVLQSLDLVSEKFEFPAK